MEKLTLKRTFNAQIEKVWDSFTNQDILKKWWSPSGMVSSFLTVDLKIDGIFRYCFKGEDGKEFWGVGKYKEINKPTKLSYLDSFSDSDGNPVAPSHYGIPKEEIEESLIEINFSEEDDKTQMVIVMDNYYDDKMTEEMLKGWNTMFDKLDSVLN